jgi:hypothetical protein
VLLAAGGRGLCVAPRGISAGEGAGGAGRPRPGIQ